MPQTRPLKPLIAVIGATGTGKSQLAVDIATRCNGEIINGDAIQLYDGLPVITNKIPVEERNGIPHHLLGCIGQDAEPWRVDKFVPKALSLIHEIHSRGKLPVLVGGTHYYTQSLLFKDVLMRNGEDDASPVTSHDDDVSMWPILNAPLPEVLSRLREVDPIIAERWHPNDDRKIRRSLQIYLKTGRKASDVYEEQKKRKQEVTQYPASDEALADQIERPGLLRFPSLVLWTHTPRDALVGRLNGRVDKMIDQGLLDELKSLDLFVTDQKRQGTQVDQSKGIWVAIGYKEFQNYMQAIKDGNVSRSELDDLRATAVEKTKKATRDYAKSQIRWIRIKLINSLGDAQASDSLFLLDTSSPETWDTSVLQPAIEYTTRFLEGSTLPDPKKESEVASKMLAAKREYDLSQRSDLWRQRTCDLCNATLVTEDDWDRHLKSRSHRNMVKKASRKEQRDLHQREMATADSAQGLDNSDSSEDEKYATFRLMESSNADAT